jgi:hypothetical protein
MLVESLQTFEDNSFVIYQKMALRRKVETSVFSLNRDFAPHFTGVFNGQATELRAKHVQTRRIGVHCLTLRVICFHYKSV